MHAMPTNAGMIALIIQPGFKVDSTTPTKANEKLEFPISGAVHHER
jgi:hypothetical protein